MPKSLRNLALMLMLALPTMPGHAGLNTDAPIPASGEFQLVVLEADGCNYCALFRRDVLPAYETSERGKDMPVRFVDVNEVGAANLDLDGPVDVVPTFVVMKHNKEIGRIPGYVGPESFFHTINYLIEAAP